MSEALWKVAEIVGTIILTGVGAWFLRGLHIEAKIEAAVRARKVAHAREHETLEKLIGARFEALEAQIDDLTSDIRQSAGDFAKESNVAQLLIEVKNLATSLARLEGMIDGAHQAEIRGRASQRS